MIHVRSLSKKKKFAQLLLKCELSTLRGKKPKLKIPKLQVHIFFLSTVSIFFLSTIGTSEVSSNVKLLRLFLM